VNQLPVNRETFTGLTMVTASALLLSRIGNHEEGKILPRNWLLQFSFSSTAEACNLQNMLSLIISEKGKTLVTHSDSQLAQ
jgi:hypothetical protein